MDHQISTPAIPWWCQIWCSTNHQPFLHQSLQLSAAEWIPHPAAILSSETKSFVPTKPLSKISILLLLEPATVPTTNDRERRRNNRMTQLWFHKETYKSDSAVSALLHLQVRTSYMVQRKPIVENSCSPSTFTNLPPQQMDAKVRQLPLATSTMAVKMGIQILLMHTNPSIENHIKPAHSAWQHRHCVEKSELWSLAWSPKLLGFRQKVGEGHPRLIGGVEETWTIWWPHGEI